MANELDKKLKTKSHQLETSSEIKTDESLLELTNLINKPEFADFVQSISDSLDDGITFDELLSSKEVLQKALKIFRKLKFD